MTSSPIWIICAFPFLEVSISFLSLLSPLHPLINMSLYLDNVGWKQMLSPCSSVSGLTKRVTWVFQVSSCSYLVSLLFILHWHSWIPRTFFQTLSLTQQQQHPWGVLETQCLTSALDLTNQFTLLTNFRTFLFTVIGESTYQQHKSAVLQIEYLRWHFTLDRINNEWNRYSFLWLMKL